MPFKFLSLLTLLPLHAMADNHDDGHDARPNILSIMSDDHAATGLSAYGSRLAFNFWLRPAQAEDLAIRSNPNE